LRERHRDPHFTIDHRIALPQNAIRTQSEECDIEFPHREADVVEVASDPHSWTVCGYCAAGPPARVDHFAQHLCVVPA